MEEIGLILGLLWIFAVGYFAVDRLGRFMERNMHSANSRTEDVPERRAQKDTTAKADGWLKYSGKR